MQNKLYGEVAVKLTIDYVEQFADETDAEMRGQCAYIAKHIFNDTPHWSVDYKKSLGYFLIPIEKIAAQSGIEDGFNGTVIEMDIKANKGGLK
jgi:hypothetical protein